MYGGTLVYDSGTAIKLLYDKKNHAVPETEGPSKGNCTLMSNAILTEYRYGGGAVGLTANASAHLRWMVAGPKISTVIKSFEDLLDNDTNCFQHHEQTRAAQQSFTKQVKAFVTVTKEMGNPFADLCDDLYVIDTKDVVDTNVVETLYQLENLKRQSYYEFVQDRLVTRTTSLFAPIKRNRLPLFSQPPTKTCSNKLQISSLKSDCSLFSRLYISCQARDGNLDDFFQHKNQSTPSSLSCRSWENSGLVRNLIFYFFRKI